MQLTDLGRTLARRWYLTLIALLASLGLAIGVFLLVPPTYQLKANVVLLPSATSVGPGGNPYLSLGGLELANDVLSRAMTSDSAHAEVTATAGQGTFEAIPDFATSGPILVVTAEGESPAAARATLKAVLDLVPQTLSKLQTALNVPTSSQITSMVLTEEATPTNVLKTRLRAVAAVLVLSLIASGFAIGLIDGLRADGVRRRSQRSSRAEAAASLDPMVEVRMRAHDPDAMAFTSTPRTSSGRETSRIERA